MNIVTYIANAPFLLRMIFLKLEIITILFFESDGVTQVSFIK